MAQKLGNDANCNMSDLLSTINQSLRLYIVTNRLRSIRR